MRKYELMVVFPLEEDQFKPGVEAVRKVLAGETTIGEILKTAADG